jgi:hypothetical protein
MRMYLSLFPWYPREKTIMSGFPGMWRLLGRRLGARRTLPRLAAARAHLRPGAHLLSLAGRISNGCARNA